MHDEAFFVAKLTLRHIKPTATRLLIVREMMRGDETVSLPELERLLPTIDKSTISRTLSLFLLHRLIHAIDDGSGALKYAVCADDEHTHFYCEHCHRTFCLKQLSLPVVPLPDGFLLNSVNYVLKGLCPKCTRKESEVRCKVIK